MQNKRVKEILKVFPAATIEAIKEEGDKDE